jgi:nucleoside diphosphate kinase
VCAARLLSLCPAVHRRSRSYGRLFTVLDYEDHVTRDALEVSRSEGLGWVTGGAVSHLGDVVSALSGAGLRVVHAKSMDLSPGDATTVLGSDEASGFGVALKLLGSDCSAKWRGLCSHPPGGIRPGSLHAGMDEAVSQVFEATLPGAATASSVASESPLIASAASATARMSGCSVAVVLPHAVASDGFGSLLQELLDGASSRGLRLTAVGMRDLDEVTSEEFLEVYKGVEPSFREMASQLAYGPCLAVEFSGEDAVRKLREVAGPRDVDVAKRVRPDTLRARFGETPARCGVHVTDLDEDGVLESEYLFGVVSG